MQRESRACAEVYRRCERCGRSTRHRLTGGLCSDCTYVPPDPALLMELRRERAWQRSGVPPLHARYRRWEELKGPEPYLRAVQMLRRFTEEGRSILIVAGPIGTGKTQAACVAVSETICADRIAKYTTCAELMFLLRAGIGDRDLQRASELDWLEKWAAPRLLVIDEYTARAGSDYENVALEALLDRRYRSLCPTILAGNIDCAMLHTAAGARIVERAREDGGVLPWSGWPSFR